MAMDSGFMRVMNDGFETLRELGLDLAGTKPGDELMLIVDQLEEWMGRHG